MLKIRLQRIGRKNDPSFRAVVVDSRQGPKSGKYVERVGSYDPRSNKIALEADRIREWIGKGAQVSDTLHNLLVSEKVIEASKKNVLPKKTPIVKEASSEASEGAVNDGVDESKKEEEEISEDATDGGTSGQPQSADSEEEEEKEEKKVEESAPAEKTDKEESVSEEDGNVEKGKDTA